MTNENESSVHVIRWQRLRAKLQAEMMQCHDCRLLRNAMILMMDIIIPPESGNEMARVETSEPLTIKAHSEVQIKEPTVRIEDGGDGTKVEQTTTTKVL